MVKRKILAFRNWERYPANCQQKNTNFNSTSTRNWVLPRRWMSLEEDWSFRRDVRLLTPWFPPLKPWAEDPDQMYSNSWDVEMPRYNVCCFNLYIYGNLLPRSRSLISRVKHSHGKVMQEEWSRTGALWIWAASKGTQRGRSTLKEKKT